jgi:glycosyltransferase involved in cell wall biosynthesis
MDNNRIDLSVVILTYNHERFIVNCLESVFKQKHDLVIEYIICDDASTDRTQDVIKKFVNKQPNKNIKLFLHNENQFQNGWSFFYELLANSNGKYVALLDGDDLWSDVNKLAKQFKILENDEKVSIVSHNYDVIDARGDTINSFRFTSNSITLQDLAHANPIGLLTVMFRKKHLPIINLSDYAQLPVGDYPIWALILEKGTGAHVAENMAQYRLHDRNYFGRQSSSDMQIARIQSLFFIHKNSVSPAFWYDALSEEFRILIRQINRLEYTNKSFNDFWISILKNNPDLIMKFKDIGEPGFSVSLHVWINATKLVVNRFLNAIISRVKKIK